MFGSVANAQQTESSSKPKPEQANPSVQIDRDAITFLRYQLAVSLNLPRHGLAARGTVVIRNDSPEALSRVALQISSTLKWAAIRSGETPLPFTSTRVTHDIDHTGTVNEAIVELPAPLAPGATLELEVGYQGTVDQDAGRLERLGAPARVARLSDWDAIAENFTAVRGVGHVVWYPVSLAPATLDQGNKVFRELGAWRSRHALSRFRATYTEDSGKMFIANGVRKSEVEKVYELEVMGLEGPFFVVADYDVQPTANGRVLHMKGHEAAAKQVAAALAKTEAVAAAGRPLPAVVIELPQGWGGYDNGNVLLMPLNGIPRAKLEQQLAHLMTHANFYSSRPWIYEGLAQMAQAVIADQQQGGSSGHILTQHATGVMLVSPVESGPNDARDSLINTTDEIYYRSKAMWVWWMLREMLTPAVLQKGLAVYQAEADKEPAYVQRLLEAASGKDLEWFFDDWVYRDRGIPDFRIVNVYPRQNMKGTYLVTITVENLGRAGAEVPIHVVTLGKGEASARLLVKAKSQATIRIETGQPPTEVTVNDGSVLESDTDNNVFAVPAVPKQ
ncbi:MAG TPA: hypothetical protein VM009_04910 [Terriglobales bacterium]|nr:hypothetical protein [Terriglobales bacterium]